MKQGIEKQKKDKMMNYFNDNGNMTVGIVDHLGYIYCTKCAEIYEKEGAPMIAMTSHAEFHTTEPCEGCRELVTTSW